MAKREKKPEINAERLGYNPFVASLKIPVWTTQNGYKKENGIWEPQEVDYDGSDAVKVFVSSDKRLITSGLNYRALQLWTWVLQTIEAGEDYIWINRTRSMEECRIKSVRTFVDAIKELCRYGFLSPCVNIRNVYFINPEMGFRGSRIKKYPNNLDFKNKEK